MKSSVIILLVAASFLFTVFAGCGRPAAGRNAVGDPASAGRSENAGGSGMMQDTGNPARAEAGAALVERLAHGRFALVSVDGVLPAATSRAPELQFAKGLQVSGSICNRFAGQGELDGAVLRVSHMAMTRMLCAEADLNEIENIFAVMLQRGARLDFDGQRLVMEQGGHRLEWVRR